MPSLISVMVSMFVSVITESEVERFQSAMRVDMRKECWLLAIVLFSSCAFAQTSTSSVAPTCKVDAEQFNRSAWKRIFESDSAAKGLHYAAKIGIAVHRARYHYQLLVPHEGQRAVAIAYFWNVGTHDPDRYVYRALQESPCITVEQLVSKMPIRRISLADDLKVDQLVQAFFKIQVTPKTSDFYVFDAETYEVEFQSGINESIRVVTSDPASPLVRWSKSLMDLFWQRK